MEIVGKIKVIGVTQSVGSSGFRKRELVVTTDEQYVQMISIQFLQDKVDILNNYSIGQEVKVSINLQGREWINPEGKAQYFNSINGWRIEALSQKTPPPQPYSAQDDDYIYTFGLTESSRNQTDKPITSYTIGVDIGRTLNDKISIFSGIHYANYGEQIMVRTADPENPNYEAAHFMGRCALYERFDAQDRANNIPYTNNYSFIEVPVGLNIAIKSFDKSRVTMDLGLNFQKMDHAKQPIACLY